MAVIRTEHHCVVCMISLLMVAAVCNTLRDFPINTHILRNIQLVGTYLTALVTFSHYPIPARSKGIPYMTSVFLFLFRFNHIGVYTCYTD